MHLDYERDGAEIYRRSFATIRAEADFAGMPEDVARVAIDGIANDDYEIVVDDLSRTVQAGLAGGVPALFPQLT